MGSAGELDQRITFQSYTLTADGAGGQIKAWANLPTAPTVWASVTAKGAREGFTEGRTTATGTYVFTIRNRTDIDELTQIIWQSETYDIRGIFREGGRKMYLKIEAERGA
jgi:SPP1 family predicted phage head-tail adaptor